MLIINAITILARGGGGGSSSGGGGGGFGIFIISYAPASFICSSLNKRFGEKVSIFLGGPLALGWGVLMGSLFGGFYIVVMPVAAIFGAVAGVRGWHQRFFKQRKIAKQTILKAAQLDPAWQSELLKQRVAYVFNQFQTDWSRLDYQNITSYTKPEYAKHAALMMAGLKNLSRINKVENLKLKQIEIVEAFDSATSEQDYFVAGIDASAEDVLVDTRSGKNIFVDKNPFTEFWRFDRVGNLWMLASIKQLTQSDAHQDPELEIFASQNGLFYSPDWGWLLLPLGGDLFGNAQFGRSDVNNHCIGLYHNLLIQIYTYLPNSQKNRTTQFVIAQVAVPNKSYGRIVVKRKPKISLFNFAPKGMQKLQTEWSDFNKKYFLYATNAEQATTFELLNPVYMEKLEALPFQINIEVVDNTVYLYTKDKNASYQIMLELLKSAFQEMAL